VEPETPQTTNDVAEIVGNAQVIASQQAALAEMEAAQVVAEVAEDIAALEQETEQLENNGQWQEKEISELRQQLNSLQQQVSDLISAQTIVVTTMEPASEIVAENSSIQSDTLELENSNPTELGNESVEDNPAPALVELPLSEKRKLRLI
jgi:predicted  nucleic acid-binding Zn-ribbon protein